MKKRIYFMMSVVVIFTLVFTGCTAWLDVKPEDRVTDEQLFSTEAGFRTALNGIYVEMNHASLYGGDLTVDVVEVIAQRYDFMNVNTELGRVAKYEYTTDFAKKKFGEIWEMSYALIANCNKIFEYAEKNKHVLTGDSRSMILGELYALRAFLHFDLLRLFGPIYSVSPDEISICYNTRFSVSASDLLPAKEVTQKVIEDLNRAEGLLAIDPIITKGIQAVNSEDGFNYHNFRAQRFNFYAVKALLARVYLYMGLNKEAYDKAKEILEVQAKWFPFTKYSEVLGGATNPDRVFSSEILFSLSNSKRSDIFKTKFSPELEPQNALLPKMSLDSFFGGEKDKDWRYLSSWIAPSNRDYKCFHKYEKTSSSVYHSALIPLIRISEMFYIVAETATDKGEALQAINSVLYNRGLTLLPEDADLTLAVEEEYKKEFWGEGQLFFFYKRQNKAKIHSLALNQSVTMDALKYVLPLPEIESNFRD